MRTISHSLAINSKIGFGHDRQKQPKCVVAQADFRESDQGVKNSDHKNRNIITELVATEAPKMDFAVCYQNIIVFCREKF